MFKSSKWNPPRGVTLVASGTLVGGIVLLCWQIVRPILAGLAIAGVGIRAASPNTPTPTISPALTQVATGTEFPINSEPVPLLVSKPAPGPHTSVLTIVYPPETEVLVARDFEPEDLSAVSLGQAITVTVGVTNGESVALRGFYYSDQVPNGWIVNTSGVTVNGSPIVDYNYEQGAADEVYAGFAPHRWALEMPQGGGVFSSTHPISASGGTARFAYTMIVSGGEGSDYAMGQDAWAGWLTTVPTGTAVFGYESIVSELVADFTADPHSGQVPLAVAFSDLSTGDPTAWAWDLGDGSPTVFQQHPTHGYTVPGTYTVTLTVTRTEPAGSDTIVKPGFITVTAPLLQADFDAQPRFGLPPLVVTFTDLSVGDVLTRVWDFGDEGTAVLPSLTHTYIVSGYYTVALTIHDAYGMDTLVRPRYIHVTDVVYDTYLPIILKSAQQ